MKILVTGANGFVGKHLVQTLIDIGYDVVGVDINDNNRNKQCEYVQMDICSIESLENLFIDKKPDKVIHLAYLHKSKKQSNSDCMQYNLACSKNVFLLCQKYNIPVLYISSCEVFGISKGNVTENSKCNPVSNYGKTKYKIEQMLKSTVSEYTIFRFSPVYTQDVQRAINCRCYISYPNWVVQINDGLNFTLLDMNKAVVKMADWCNAEPNNQLEIVKDEKPFDIKGYVQQERQNGRAKHIIKMPKALMSIAYHILKLIMPKEKSYKLYKFIYPLQFK